MKAINVPIIHPYPTFPNIFSIELAAFDYTKSENIFFKALFLQGKNIYIYNSHFVALRPFSL
jgi:hypothetical protein